MKKRKGEAHSRGHREHVSAQDLRKPDEHSDREHKVPSAEN